MNLYHTRSVFSLIPKLLGSCPMIYFFNIWGGGRVIILFGFCGGGVVFDGGFGVLF